MKIIGFNILGKGIVGNGVDSWTEIDLSGNTPIHIINDIEPIPSGYSDISTIVNWAKYGDGLNDGFNYVETRKEIQKLLSAEASTGNTSGLTSSELEIVQQYNLDKYYALYDYFEKLPESIDVKQPPVDLNYDILGLHKKRMFDKGELYRVEYYADYDFATETYDKLIIHEDRTYYRINQFVYLRDMTICWHYNDYSSGATKNTLKYYTKDESVRVGERRRRNVMSNVKIETVGLIMMTSGTTQQDAEILGLQFLSDYSNEIDVYIEGAESHLKNALLTDTNHSWLDNEIPNTGGVTIRLYLYDSINIDYTVNNTNT